MRALTGWTLLLGLVAAMLARGEVRAVEVLGVGTGFLLGGDLTDPENDGQEAFYLPPNDYGGFDAEFFSSDESAFGGGEAAFNVFDNVAAGGGDAKWCCGTAFPQIVGADFRPFIDEEVAFRLTHFTVTSANDSPDRDPRVWWIQGSNDGECWTTIFAQSDPSASLWTARDQVLLFREGDDYPEQDTAYSMFRMVTLQTNLTAGAFFQLGEIELFGEEDDRPTGPGDCSSCFDPVLNVVVAANVDGDLDVSWENPEGCGCEDPTVIVIEGVEVASVDPGETSAVVPADSLPDALFTVDVRNCSQASATGTLFKTDAAGYIVGSSWLALGPFATPVACDDDVTLFLTNSIGPEESIVCQFPLEGDPVEGYVPGDPLFPDPATASTSGYHLEAPTDEFGNPVWRRFSDATPADGQLNFDQSVSATITDLTEQVQFVATWVENVSGEPLELQVCFGSDDHGQVWVDNALVHNQYACRAHVLCQTTFFFTLPEGVHVIKIGLWEQAGGWITSLGLVDPLTLEPIIDLGGVLDPGVLVGVSPLSNDIIFHGIAPPDGYAEPPCDDTEICLPVTGLNCTRNPDGTIDLFWENSDGCDQELQILAGGRLVDTVAATTTSYRIDDPDLAMTTSVSVDNGSYAMTSCSLVEVLPGLLGSDLTDIDDDGVETLYFPPGDYGGFDAEFFSSDKPGFNGGEAAYNVFDNVIAGGGDAKWCCGTVFPQIVGADFRNTLDAEFILTHFTVTSANDTPERDPRVWRIQGSNDGVEWTTIFQQDDPNASLWTARDQVLLFQEGREYAPQEEPYSMFRMITDATGLAQAPTAFFQLGEIELFGEEDGGPREICDNDIDDDGDDLVDCEDPSCAQDAACKGTQFVRGDADADGNLNITDGIFVLNYLFLGGGTPPCLEAANTNGDADVNITDGIFILNYLFLGGPEPPEPGAGACGTDPRSENLGCESFPPCE